MKSTNRRRSANWWRLPREGCPHGEMIFDPCRTEEEDTQERVMTLHTEMCEMSENCATETRGQSETRKPKHFQYRWSHHLAEANYRTREKSRKSKKDATKVSFVVACILALGGTKPQAKQMWWILCIFPSLERVRTVQSTIPYATRKWWRMGTLISNEISLGNVHERERCESVWWRWISVSPQNDLNQQDHEDTVGTPATMQMTDELLQRNTVCVNPSKEFKTTSARNVWIQHSKTLLRLAIPESELHL